MSARELRVPTGNQAVHENGVRGVDTLQIVVGNLDSNAADYRKVVDAESNKGEANLSIGQASESVAIAVGRHTVELHQPVGAGDAAARLSNFGAGPYRVRFYGDSSFEIEPSELDGARISCVRR